MLWGFFAKLFGKSKETKRETEENVNLAVIFYSMGGTNYQLAKWAEEGAKEVGADVRIFKVEELAPESVIESNEGWKATVEKTKNVPVVTSDDIEWADAMIFCVPTRFGNMPSQMKQFLDTQGGLWANGKTVNKVVSAMTSAQNPHGGHEATLLSLYTSMTHWGALIATPGFTDQSVPIAGGNPYGTSVTVDQNGQMVDDVEAAVKHQAKRTVHVAKWVKKGNRK